MKKGKMCAQSAHATLAAYKRAVQVKCEFLRPWELTGQPKIALKVNSEAELYACQTKINQCKTLILALLCSEKAVQAAREAGIVACTIRDAGHTQVAADSLTAAAIGPGMCYRSHLLAFWSKHSTAPATEIDRITGALKLL